VLVPVGDAAALAEAVVGLLTDPARAAALARAARERFTHLPTEADVVGQWARRYAGLGAVDKGGVFRNVADD
jgi:glycosyltransferase involved in cell wall biosynthesis